MKWYVGVDGGGSKTEFAVSAGDGKTAAAFSRGGCSYHMLGGTAAVTLLTDGVVDCLALVGAKLADCKGCCIGVPCYGESPTQDKEIFKALQSALAGVPLYLTNDVEVGWAGALECSEGIHLVAGTGSIAFGRDADGKTMRCGGWNEFFGDEGSCYWAGRQAMSLFSKQADGRAPRGALYDIVRQKLSLENDLQLIDVLLRDWIPYRDKVALFQLMVQQAAEQGDLEAAKIYEAAADELALMVKAIMEQLRLPTGKTAVSYSGGIFKAGRLVLEPLQKAVKALGCNLESPRHSPVEGALMLANQHKNGRF